MTVTVFGIRHHGPGCARSLRMALGELRPDLVLVEGPPDADELIPGVAMAGMVPPVAILVWQHDDSARASFYPFARFSPEWQALTWALEHGVPARFCDLPCAIRFALDAEGATDERDGGETADPLAWLAHADGYSDSERWWNDRIEETASGTRLFAAINAAVAAVRDELQLPESRLTLLREATMRRMLREAEKAGFANIAFVCGAWHAPAVTGEAPSGDAALLKGLPKTKVRTTWTPWTNERLTRRSGYGAGVHFPGWYEHLFAGGDDLVSRWLVRAARVLRNEDLPASSASVIEATRLATTLASLRGRPVPGMPELDASIRAVFCSGETTWRSLLDRSLFVGDRLGELPPDVARLPLEEDVLATAKSLRLKQTAGPTPIELDLREDGGRARSTFLHRLLALRLPWGTKQDAGRTRGTFKEAWSLQWRPDFALAIVDAAAFGNSVETAAAHRLAHTARATAALAELVPLLETSLLADLPAATASLLDTVRERSASTGDVAALFDAIPALVRIARYGNVRDTDGAAVRTILVDLVVRAHVGLPAAATGIDDEAAAELSRRLREHHAALRLLADEPLLAGADAALGALLDRSDVHAQVRGAATRLLRDRGTMAQDDVARRLANELSPGAPPSQAAAWLDGLLAEAGHVLVHDPRLLQLLDDWVRQLTDEHFQNVLPIVRRTFGSFPGPERRGIAAALRSPRRAGAARPAGASLAIDAERAVPAIDAVARILGLRDGGAAP